MSTLTFTYNEPNPIGDVYLAVGWGTLTYNITTTSTSTTCSVSQVSISNESDGSATYSYSISFDGSTIASGSVSLSRGASTTRSISGSKSVTRGHYNTTARLSVSGSGAGGTASGGTTITVNARPSYTVSYNANSGSNPPTSQVKWHDESLTLSSSKPYRAGYVFWHWNTSSSNAGTTYSPGGQYSSNSAMTIYAIWNPIITYDANAGGVSSLPASQTKTYGTTLSLSSTIPQRRGYQFRFWTTKADGTGSTYSSGASYTSNTATTLYAQWLKVADPPNVSSVKVIRCNSDGTANDNGTYCYVEAGWSVDTTSAGMSANTGELTGTISPSIGGSSTYTFYEGYSGTSGIAKAIIENCDTDTTYTVSVTVTNTVVGTSQSTRLSTTSSNILSSSHFIMDFKAGGGAIGIGSAAPLSGLKIGWPTVFEDNVTIDGNITAANLKYSVMTDKETIFSYIAPNWTCRSVNLHRYGRMAQFEAVFACSSSISTSVSANFIAYIASTYAPVGNLYYTTYYGKGNVGKAGGIDFTATQAVSANVAIYVNVVYISKT